MSHRHLGELETLATNDPIFEKELKRARLERAVLEAGDEVRRQQAVRATAFDSPASDAVPVTLQDHTAELAAMSKLATSRENLLRWKLSSLAPLRTLGYATWQEVALVERDLAVVKAARQSIAEAQEIASLRHQRTQLVRQMNGDPTHTAMVEQARQRTGP